MKILQISHRNYIAGGSDAVFFATSEMLESMGHQVLRFCMDDPQNQPHALSGYFPRGADTANPAARDAVRYFWNCEAAQRLKALLRDHGPIDLAHLHIYHGKMTPAILPVLRRANIPVVHTLHEYKLACPVYTMERDGKICSDCADGTILSAVKHRCKEGSAIRSLVMATEFLTARALGDVRHVDQFICVSDFQRRMLKRSGLPEDKLATLHNFVDTGIFCPAEAPGDALLYFGRIEKLKGVETMIRAVAQTGQKLHIIGDGHWVEPMRKMIEGLENVRYLGFQSGAALRRMIARAKAVIVPSEWYENCPMSVLEAKASGVPVIGANIGGIPELVQHEQDGLLFSAGDAVALATALGRLEQLDPSRLRKTARKNALERFSRRAHAENLLSLYSQAEGMAFTRRPPKCLQG